MNLFYFNHQKIEKDIDQEKDIIKNNSKKIAKINLLIMVLNINLVNNIKVRQSHYFKVLKIN